MSLAASPDLEAGPSSPSTAASSSSGASLPGLPSQSQQHQTLLLLSVRRGGDCRYRSSCVGSGRRYAGAPCGSAIGACALGRFWAHRKHLSLGPAPGQVGAEAGRGRWQRQDARFQHFQSTRLWHFFTETNISETKRPAVNRIAPVDPRWILLCLFVCLSILPFVCKQGRRRLVPGKPKQNSHHLPPLTSKSWPWLPSLPCPPLPLSEVGRPTRWWSGTRGHRPPPGISSPGDGSRWPAPAPACSPRSAVTLAVAAGAVPARACVHGCAACGSRASPRPCQAWPRSLP